MSKVTIGIDPGINGALAVINGTEVFSMTFTDATIGNVVKEAVEIVRSEPNRSLVVYIESVHAFPGQGVSSCFKFGRAYGEALGALDALEAPYRLVSPMKWQKTIIGIPKKKDGATAHKRALKMEAQRRFPQCKPTLKTCDALLIADWGSKDRI